MKDAITFARYLINKNPSEFNNNFDGNMKLQKMLFFANMVHLSSSGDVLFNDAIQAFEKGCVVENVRTEYYICYENLKSSSENFEYDFSREQYDSLKKVNEIFGHLSAKTLSDLTHEFDFWKLRYENSKNEDGSYDQNKNIITKEDMKNEVEKISNILSIYKSNIIPDEKFDVINGIKFYFEDSMKISEDVISKLYEMSSSGELDDDAYSVCYEKNELMVY